MIRLVNWKMIAGNIAYNVLYRKENVQNNNNDNNDNNNNNKTMIILSIIKL
jgi:hypothetical protein